MWKRKKAAVRKTGAGRKEARGREGWHEERQHEAHRERAGGWRQSRKVNVLAIKLLLDSVCTCITCTSHAH